MCIRSELYRLIWEILNYTNPLLFENWDSYINQMVYVIAELEMGKCIC